MLKNKENKETLNQIGEREILNRLKKFMDIGQIDDDTSVIDTNQQKLIINTDVLVEKVHFSEETTFPENIGWKAIAANVSDLISSGSEKIIGITVGLITPPDTEWCWVNGVYKGMQEALEKFGGKLLGGDCSQGKQKILAITAVGSLGPLRLHRSNAQPGDLLVTSGPHGLSRLGLALLQSEEIPDKNLLTENLKKQSIKAHQTPSPPIEALRHLLHCKPPKIPWRAAGTDSSDGFLDSLSNISSSSNCSIIIDTNQIPKAKDWPEGNNWDKWCLNGGEDYEMVLTLPPSWAKEWIRLVPSGQIVGEITKGPPNLLWKNGEEINIKDYTNFTHF